MCLLFTLLTVPVHATFHKMEESNHVECHNVNNVTEELLANFSVCKDIFITLLISWFPEFVSSLQFHKYHGFLNFFLLYSFTVHTCVVNLKG